MVTHIALGGIGLSFPPSILGCWYLPPLVLQVFLLFKECGISHVLFVKMFSRCISVNVFAFCCWQNVLLFTGCTLLHYLCCLWRAGLAMHPQLICCYWRHGNLHLLSTESLKGMHRQLLQTWRISCWNGKSYSVSCFNMMNNSFLHSKYVRQCDIWLFLVVLVFFVPNNSVLSFFVFPSFTCTNTYMHVHKHVLIHTLSTHTDTSTY